MTNNNTIKLGVLSSHCWVQPSFKEQSNFKSLSLLADFNEISLKQIPPIKRRRLSGLSKIAMHSTLCCLEQSDFTPEQPITVFASQHGELNRTTNIVESMLHQLAVSPKDFSLSVHNASLGLYSIFTGNKNPGTSIAAESNTFGYALLESYLQLQRFPDSQVLLTCFDLQVGAPFSELQQKLYPSYSLSLLLTKPSAAYPAISFTFEPLKSHQSPELPLALSFYDFLQSGEQQRALNSLDTCWEFVKHVS